MSAVSFEVFADPAPQGSKTVVPTAQGHRTKESSKGVKPFRVAVRAEAVEAMGDNDPMTGPVALTIYFWQPRPTGHFGTGKNEGTLRPSAATWKQTRPDLSKLTRAVEDALTGVVYRDDGQIAQLHCYDRYVPLGYSPRVIVEVEQIEPPEEIDA